LRIIGKRALGEPKRTGAVQRRAQSRLLRASQALGQSMVEKARAARPIAYGRFGAIL
jgi:hypothetical protein